MKRHLTATARNIFLHAFFLFDCILTFSQSYNFTSIDSLLNANLSGVFNGKLVCMVSHNDSLIYYYNQGADSLTAGGIASATKTMSAALMLRMVQEGTIALDDSIGSNYPFSTSLGKGTITIRQLFAHTSGMAGTTEYNANPSINLQQSADSILTFDPLVYTPIGTKFSYTGEDQQVAGAAAELASGISWDNLFATKIAQPLGLKNTSFYATTPANPRVAGGIRTTASDMIRFGSFVLHNGKNQQGTQVVDSTLMQQLWIDQTNHALQVGSPYPHSPKNNNPYNASTIYYGIGTWLDIYNPVQHYQEQISADGAFGGIIWINRCTNMVGAFLTFPPSNYITTFPVEYLAMDMFRNAVPSTCYLTTLPLTLLSFDAYQKDESDILEWSTVSEVNTKDFSIERSSDAHSFEEIAKVNAAGKSNRVIHYNYVDNNIGHEIFAWKIYYRLKETNSDGKIAYSNTISVEHLPGNETVAEIYPNPGRNLILISSPDIIKKISIYNLSGKNIFKSDVDKKEFSVNISKYRSGIYWIKIITSSNSVMIKKLLVQ